MRMWDGMGAVSGVLVFLWLAFSLALLVLMVLAAVWLARSLGSDGRRPSGGGAALEALDLRYARGEIGREDYLQARRDLEGSSG